MLCPHCQQGFHFFQQNEVAIPDDFVYHGNAIRGTPGSTLRVFKAGYCPECKGVVLVHYLRRAGSERPGGTGDEYVGIVYPRKHARKPVPPEVPKNFAEDYDEACLVLEDSAKASAALSRRLLQHVFHEHYGIREHDLSTEIKKFLSTHNPPSYLADPLDAIRHVGNFAAHPLKDTSTGTILDVEPGEAEWLVGLLDTLFDYAFVQPERQRQKITALNAKLTAAGKPTIPVPPPTSGS
jgi:hypothetical protein